MQNEKIVIIDYGMGNLRSVEKNLHRSGYSPIISDDPTIVATADKLILPGVGHFANGMKNLSQRNLIEVLNDKVLIEKVPILGICLGMQLFGKTSEEGNAEGLRWIEARTVRFNVGDKQKYKIPHMGWNSIIPSQDSKLLSGISSEDLFYFVHSFHLVCSDKGNILTSTKYDFEFTSAVVKDNIYGVQFHPEKSHKQGMRMLKNFAEFV